MGVGGSRGGGDGFPSPARPGAYSLARVSRSQQLTLKPSSRSVTQTDGMPGSVKGKGRGKLRKRRGCERDGD